MSAKENSEDPMTPAETAARGLAAVRGKHPMVHHITNSVVMNLTANITLCLGAAPVMAACIQESPEMVRQAGALLLNIGTLDPAQVKSMLAAGKAANSSGIPVILDPVGAGATRLRTEAAVTLLTELEISVIRGNAGEILALAGAGGKVRGVDSMEGLDRRVDVVTAYAGTHDCVIAVTGEVDLVTDGTRVVRISNGHPMMGRVTGTGCGATTAIACFAAAVDDPLEAATGGLICYGIAGEAAAAVASGPGTFVPYFLDALAGLDSGMVARLTRAEELC
jgi:hydroxyethylthiazole kinase